MCPRPLSFSTRAVHAGAAPDPATGARTFPIYQSNGFVFDDLEHGADIFALKRAGFAYARGSNPNCAALERRVADLEGGKSAIAVGSGQAAWFITLLTLLGSGDRYVGASRMFGGSLGLMKRMDQRLNIGVQWAEPEAASIAAAITSQTKAIIIESIINPTGEIVDLPAIAAVAKAHNLPLIVDNTLASPALLRPIEHGADIVLHSASKFLAGHGHVIGGIIVDAGRFDWKNDTRFPLISSPWPDYDDIVLPEAFPETAFTAAARLTGMREYGPGLAPILAQMIATATETLPLRMEKHCTNALAVARYLASHPAVAVVSHPLLGSEEQRKLAARLMPDGVGSIFTATLKGGENAAKQVLTSVKLFSHLVNIGESRSLLAHPATTTHRTLNEATREGLGITPGTLRISIGLEDEADLIADLDQALRGL
ncbi:MAG: aminotransferase class I/II-fold pyridoxal phosphate-dependent enzyme [Rhizobiales bacterium]|nr:aminotransferase class I/II-fold pyridoxal phosphate-dependent enzyme [Hyphomicrobiales bacterium]